MNWWAKKISLMPGVFEAHASPKFSRVKIVPYTRMF